MKRHRLVARLVAYVWLGACALILPASAQDCPELVSRWPYGPDFAVAVSGTYAYYSSGTALRVASISNPTTPLNVGEAVLPGFIYGVAVSGGYAYVAAFEAGLRVIDVSTPAHPVEIGSIDTPGWARGLTFSGSHAYVADYDAGLRVIDVSNPSAPVEEGSVDTPGLALAVAVDGNYAYVADYSGDLRVIDVSVPADPREIASLSTPGSAWGVAVSGGYVYVAAYDTLRVIDVSTPSRPVEVSFFDTPGSTYGVAISGSYAYVADYGAGLRVIDISMPESPFEVASVFTPGKAFGVAVGGSYAYVADSSGGLRLIDVSTPAYPLEVASLDSAGWAFRVAVSGSYAYVAETSTGLRVFDITNPADPLEVGFFSRTWDPYDVAVSGDFAYVTDRYSGLRVFHLSPSSDPVEVGHLDTAGFDESVAVSGSYAFVAAFLDGLRAIDISDPTNPVEVAWIDTPAHAVGVAVDGNYAYVADSSSGLRVINVATPQSPFEVAWTDTPSLAQSVAVSGHYAYVADHLSGLRVVDIETPEYPIAVGSADTPNYATSVALSGRYAYVADRYSGLRVIDVSDPSSPAEAGYYDTPGQAWDVSVADGFVYVTDHYAGWAIFRECGGANSPPAVGSIEDQVVDEGDPLGFTVAAVDPDRDSLTYSAIGLPPGATLDPVSGRFAYTPGYDVSTSDVTTSFEVTFLASDGRGGIGTESARITVNDLDGGTPPGENVEVTPVDPDTGIANETIDLTFSGVDTAGITSATTLTNGAPPPTGFRLGNNTYTEITTTASFEPPIHICIDYSSFGITGSRESRLALYHFVAPGDLLADGSVCTESNGCWDNITDPDNSPEDPNPDTLNDIVCGTSNSLSPFAVVEAIEITAPMGPIQVNTSAPASMDLGEPLTADEAVWDWGDGSQETMAVTTGMIEANHAYSEAGIYIPRVTLRYAGEEVGSAEFKYLVVYDPEGGFVTGGGWIDSPAGAYVPDPTLTGRANFGFVSKYRRGASVPTGNTEFRFQSAELEFHSTSYQWLVIANHKAIYKGDGAINGEEGYRFMISAIDGDLPGGGGADKFRMKIWVAATDEIVYDNQMGANDDAPPNTVIGGGSIVIHR